MRVSGHIQLHRVTSAEKEEIKKREKKLQNQKDPDQDDIDRTTWAKYTLGLKHQVIVHSVRIIILLYHTWPRHA